MEDIEHKWIDWQTFTPPEDVRGLLIKYEDGIFSDSYDYDTKKRKYREGKRIIGWRFMERSNPKDKSIQCVISKEMQEGGFVWKCPDLTNLLVNEKFQKAKEICEKQWANIVMDRT